MATEFNTQVGNGEYRLHFKTDNREYYMLMQSTARRCVDGSHMTNADHIRSMSDEEMAETFIKGDCIGCPILYECDPYGDCKPQILNWLKQPFEGE